MLAMLAAAMVVGASVQLAVGASSRCTRIGRCAIGGAPASESAVRLARLRCSLPGPRCEEAAVEPTMAFRVAITWGRAGPAWGAVITWAGLPPPIRTFDAHACRLT